MNHLPIQILIRIIHNLLSQIEKYPKIWEPIIWAPHSYLSLNATLQSSKHLKTRDYDDYTHYINSLLH